MAKLEKVKLSTGLTGVAGELYVAAVLTRKGYIATFTQKNTKGIDILVSNVQATRAAQIQVKATSERKGSWVITKKSEDFHSPRLFYVFVGLGGVDEHPEFHVVPSKSVADYVKEDHAKWLKAPGKKGQPHKDNDMRIFKVSGDEFKNRWDLLELDEPNETVKELKKKSKKTV